MNEHHPKSFVFAIVWLVGFHAILPLVALPFVMRTLEGNQAFIFFAVAVPVWLLGLGTCYAVWRSRQWAGIALGLLVAVDVILAAYSFTVGELRLQWDFEHVVTFLVAATTVWALDELRRHVADAKPETAGA